LEQSGLLKHLTLIRAQHVDMKWVEAIHDKNYIRRFEEVCLAGHQTFDSQDNQMCRDTYEIAQLAAGGVIETMRMLMAGEIDNAFCAVRPPGHHAERDKAMGFCYFNNVAIAARYLQMEHGVERVGIIDFDVHHGNGTQHIFEKDPSVFYYSIHQHPSFTFPGTGREFEQGAGEGYGFTKNSPALPGQGDEAYGQFIENDLKPAMERFKPQFLLLSAGFDAHKEDEMADMHVTTEGFSQMMRSFIEIAEKYAGGRLVSVLEGGYSLKRLPELAVNHVKLLLDI
ncbi:MAG: histone deacetylase, partial [Desulfosarcinaceae bacterium]